jgi:pilus assembly protein CpaB
MRGVFGLVLVAGVGLAGTAVYVVRGQMQATAEALALERAAAAQQVPTVEVMAVNRQIVYGEPLTPADVQVIRYAEPFLPEGVFLTMEDLFPQGENVPRQVLRQMEVNEPVLALKVTAPGEVAGITSSLSPGMRAFAVSVDVASGVSGFLRPGDRVDIYWTGTAPGGNQGEITRLIESGVTLVAVDQNTDDNMEAGAIARTVTVEVTPQQVAALAQAQSTGSLSLSLVGLTDQSVAGAIEVDQRSLLDMPEDVAAPEVVPEAPPEVCTSRIRRGTEVIDTVVECDN